MTSEVTTPSPPPTATAAPDPVPVVVIEPTSGWAALRLRELWQYRELLYFMLWRDVKSRYRQMAFGPLWIILAPLIQMLIISLVFGVFAQLPSDGVPYPVFTYVALLPWQFFANSVRQSSGSLVSQKHIISKVYFPRTAVPVAAVAATFIDFLVSFVILLLMMLVFRLAPTWKLVSLPLFLLLAAGMALGIGLWLAGLAVKYRDVAIAVGFMLTIWQYLTPVAYSSSLVPARWLWLYQLNPMYSVIEGFRWALIGTGNLPTWALVTSSLSMLLLLLTGAFYFRRTERNIVDLI